MLGAIRRVISGDALDSNNINNNTNNEQQQQQAAAPHQPTNGNAATTASPSPSPHHHHHHHPAAVVVEHDNDIMAEYNNSDHNAPLNLIAAQALDRDGGASDNFTTSSSLSDASAQGDIDNIDNMHGNIHGNLMDGGGAPMEDVYMDDASPTPLAGVGSRGRNLYKYGSSLGEDDDDEEPPAHYQQHLEHRVMALLGSTQSTHPPAPPSDHQYQHPNNQMQQQQQHQMQLQHQHNQQHHRMQRMESSDDDSARGNGTTASQNSSRDWGWFEDEHQQQIGSGGSHHSTPGSNRGSGGGKRRATNSNRSNQRSYQMVIGMDPRDDDKASVMAVTAPTYVLEESMSSQLLWKDSAGRRPPQPVDERAFYEQMWAQNFAKSQVNYQIPEEVLTATTHFSLSPFADGGTMEISPEAAADGGNDFQYNMTINNPPADNHTTMMMPSTAMDDADCGGNGGGDPSDEHHGPRSGGGGLKETPRQAPPSVLPPTQQQPLTGNKQVAKTEDGEEMCIMVRGDNVFGTTVSKSFAVADEKGGGAVTNVVTVNISIASYRVVESRKRGKYAQFLVIYREGSIRDTIGVWKRYSDFDDLARKVTQAHEGCASVIANMSPLAITEEHEVEHLPNAITSWRLLKKRQRWYRCLDSGYLSLKVFLLERFLHDILFESSSPQLLREFVGGDGDP